MPCFEQWALYLHVSNQLRKLTNQEPLSCAKHLFARKSKRALWSQHKYPQRDSYKWYASSIAWWKGTKYANVGFCLISLHCPCCGNEFLLIYIQRHCCFINCTGLHCQYSNQTLKHLLQCHCDMKTTLCSPLIGTEFTVSHWKLKNRRAHPKSNNVDNMLHNLMGLVT